MIRAVLHLASEAAWTVVFKLAERRFPPEDDAPQPSDEAARVRARWLRSHQTDDGAAAPPATPHAKPAATGGEQAAESATTTAALSSPHPVDTEYSDLEYATRLDGTVMPAPRVLPHEYCWCGGEVGARSPGDHLGLGCLANIMHNWNAASQKSQDLIEAQTAPKATPYDCRNCEDSDPGALHALDQHCAADKCEPGCEFFAPHPSHPCGGGS